MPESPIAFKSEGQQIVGIFHVPDTGKGPFPAVLFLHGFTGSKQEAHRMFVTTARRLAERGIVSLRFDFRGSGDSQGSFAEATLGGEVADARTALAYLRARPEVDSKRTALLGMSMGGLVASYVLGSDATIQHAVLWLRWDILQNSWIVIPLKRQTNNSRQRAWRISAAGLSARPSSPTCTLSRRWQRS